MKLRTRLTLLFTVITMLLTGVFGGFIYFSSEKERENSFYIQLQNEAIAKSDLFFSSNLTEKEMHKLYRNNNRTLNEVQVAIYDQHFNLIYHDDAKVDYVKETPKMLSKIFSGKKIKQSENELQIVGITYLHNGKKYAITAAADDKYGKESINNLLLIICISFVSISLFIYVAGIFLSRNALKPVGEIVLGVKNITAGKLQMRLKLNNQKDEIHELAQNFNQMLERLESSFDSQKHFVSNISHELRTPLATIISETEIALQRDRSSKEYQQTLRSILEDAQNMTRLSNSLMDLAKAGFDADEISFNQLRIDEILLDSSAKITKENPFYNISFNMEDDLEEENLIILGNEYLLLVAFNNLIENACKYSDNQKCSISIKKDHQYLRISFENQGKEIAKQDLPFLFNAFYRSQNASSQNGHGIGLFLTEKIVNLHNAHIFVSSENKTIIFSIDFPISA